MSDDFIRHEKESGRLDFLNLQNKGGKTDDTNQCSCALQNTV